MNGHGAMGLLLVSKGRHPQEYKKLLKPAMVCRPPLSLLAFVLDTLGLDSLVCSLSPSIHVTISQRLEVELCAFHVIALVILITNRIYTKFFLIDVLSITEILLLTLPRNSA
jgi:hypothetical protein